MKNLILFLVIAPVIWANAGIIGRTAHNGYPVIIPTVKRLEPASGTFALPRDLTVSAPESLNLKPLEQNYQRLVTGGRIVRCQTGALCSFKLTAGGVPENDEGYKLVISPQGMLVSSRNVRGLYYGMQTIGWILRNRGSEHALKCCTITDWP
ncbi:MAG: glycoside hydrolase family 20 zincin-like fold domain-containing protein, partial [Victivallales bacterium]|nr:glycoside hydrolase family 20 zincin-like fold domain-containing protein [Victivallales bacterium]